MAIAEECLIEQIPAARPVYPRPRIEPAGGPAVHTKRRTLKTDVLIISDVHLGSEVCRAKELRRVLASWYPYNRLIILGDLFDDLNFSRLTKHHFGLLDDFRRLTKPKRGVTIDWIEGNHDEKLDQVIPHLIGAQVHKELTLELFGKNYLFIHGHQFDDFMNSHPRVTAVASAFYEGVQRRQKGKQTVSRWLKKQSKTWLKCCEKLEHRAVAYAGTRGADVVMCGHTHYYNAAAQREENGIEYYNTGTWADSPSTLITIDEKGLKRHLYE